MCRKHGQTIQWLPAIGASEHGQSHTMPKIKNTLAGELMEANNKNNNNSRQPKILANDNNFIITLYKCTFSACLIPSNENGIVIMIAFRLPIESLASFKWGDAGSSR